MRKLPPSFTSLYRLLLRASSASVLHQNVARKQLRRLFRPLFDAAAQVVGDLQNSQLSPLERIRHQCLLNSFHQRIDITLSFLLNSAQYRGTPHRTIYNINRLRKAHAIWIHGKYYSGSKNAWNAKVVVADKSHSLPRPRDLHQMERNRVHEHCWDALGEVVRMAEGRHHLSMGRLRLKPWMLEKQ